MARIKEIKAVIKFKCPSCGEERIIKKETSDFHQKAWPEEECAGDANISFEQKCQNCDSHVVGSLNLAYMNKR